MVLYSCEDGVNIFVGRCYQHGLVSLEISFSLLYTLGDICIKADCTTAVVDTGPRRFGVIHCVARDCSFVWPATLSRIAPSSREIACRG